MVGIHQKHGLCLAPVGCVNEHSPVSRLLNHPLDGCGVRRNNGKHPPRGDHAAKTDVHKLHSRSLLDVLGLLPDFFQLGLDLHHNSRQTHIGAFGADGVGLPVHFLKQEVQLPSDSPAGGEHVVHLL